MSRQFIPIQCHTYSHAGIIENAGTQAVLQRELFDSKRLIEDAFGRRVSGLTTPGGYWQGLVGQRPLLRTIAAAGYRYARSFGLGPGDSLPALLTQPYWYSDDGQPDLLELGAHAWHDNVLTRQPGLSYWPPVLRWGLPARPPK